MKQAYTSYHSILRRLAKELQMTPESVVSHYAKSDNPEIKNTIVPFLMELAVIQGHAKHLFIKDPALVRWLINCIGKDGVENIHYEVIRELVDVNILVIHFPTCLNISSICVAVAKGLDKLAINLPCNIGGGRAALSSVMLRKSDTKQTLEVECGKITNIPEPILSQLIDFYPKLLAGLSCYVSAFPETLREGLPEDTKHPAQHQHKNTVNLEVHEKIRLPKDSDGTHASPVPHFRNGHFRTLRSEHFTKARHKSIWIEDTFVNAKNSKTVVSLEQCISS